MTSHFWVRAVAGLGGHVHITPRVSLGALVDFGWPGTVVVQGFASFHFGGRI